MYKRQVLECTAVDPTKETVASGSAEVLAPTEKMRYETKELPKVQLLHEDRFGELLETCERLPALACAVVHPCSADALRGAIEAAEQNLIVPILILSLIHI